MDGGNEHSIVIKLYFKAGLSATETLVLIQMSYGNEALKCSKDFRWYSRFRERNQQVKTMCITRNITVQCCNISQNIILAQEIKSTWLKLTHQTG
jgi:hypothetical protein